MSRELLGQIGYLESKIQSDLVSGTKANGEFRFQEVRALLEEVKLLITDKDYWPLNSIRLQVPHGIDATAVQKHLQGLMVYEELAAAGFGRVADGKISQENLHKQGDSNGTAK